MAQGDPKAKDWAEVQKTTKQKMKQLQAKSLHNEAKKRKKECNQMRRESKLNKE